MEGVRISSSTTRRASGILLLGSVLALYLVLVASRMVACPECLGQNTMEMHSSSYRDAKEYVSISGVNKASSSCSVCPVGSPPGRLLSGD